MSLVRRAIEKYVPKTLFKDKTENYELLHVMKELDELEAKAEKWDMIQWAIENKIYFAGMGVAPIFKSDMECLEQLYKECGKHE